MPETAAADLFFIETAQADARRTHGRTDVAVERLGRTNRGTLAHHSEPVELELDVGLLEDDALKHLAQAAV